MAKNIGRWLMLATAGLLTPSNSLPVSAASANSAGSAPVERECFEEGNGQRFCAELVYGCPTTDVSCLIDDLSGAILRAQGDRNAKYAAYLARGIVSRRDSRVADALADFEAAQALQPQQATPHILLGQLYSDLGHHARALSSFDDAVKIAPGLPTILAQRAAARHRGGDSAGAIADLDKAIAVMRSKIKLPDGADEPVEALLVARGEFRRKGGDTTGARSDFLAALTIQPGLKAAVDALATLP